jgi:protoporphyrinogen oxidase
LRSKESVPIVKIKLKAEPIVKPKDDIPIIGLNNPDEKRFNDKLDLYKYTADVHSRLRKDIKADFVLARLSPEDKEGVIEMTTNAYAAKLLIDMLAENTIKDIYNKEKKMWERRYLTEEERKDFYVCAKNVFENIMVRVTMTSVMNRNVDKNALIKILAGYGDDDGKEVADSEISAGVKNGLQKLFKSNEKPTVD